jgi:hypothetical protein
MCPDFEGKHIQASLQHLRDLYAMESAKPLRYAHQLNDKVLNPKPIERSKVSLADRFFHDSTIFALEYYADKEQHPEWRRTSNFLSLIRRFWNCVNVQSPCAASMKRDSRRSVVSKDDLSQIVFLKSFADWLRDWKNTCDSKKALTRETFSSLIHFVDSVTDLTSYVLQEFNYSYVLLGHVNSDPLEGRFSWYRQLSGANYFVSLKQLIEAEKKIRLYSLVKFGRLDMTDIKETMIASKVRDNLHVSEMLLSLLPMDDLPEDLIAQQAGIIYYVAGYIARSISKQVKKECCMCLFTSNSSRPELAIEEEPRNLEEIQLKEDFTRLVNRGGLLSPSDSLFVICFNAFKLRHKIFSIKEAESFFLSDVENQRETFIDVFFLFYKDDFESNVIFETCCSEGHVFKNYVNSIVQKFFHTSIKNYIADKNSQIHSSKKRYPQGDPTGGRKIKKLSSN